MLSRAYRRQGAARVLSTPLQSLLRRV